MIKVEALEKADKMKEKMSSKKETRKMTDDIKPKKAFKPPKMPRATPEENTPKKLFTEYRSLISPVVAGVTWWVISN